MPTWIDLSEHDVELNVQQDPEGKSLVLRSLPGGVIPQSVTELGFEKDGALYRRTNLRFTLPEIIRHFPKAKSRQMEMSEIFYIPTSDASRAVPAAAGTAGAVSEQRNNAEKAPWQMTSTEWIAARRELATPMKVSANSESARIGRLAELSYGVTAWRHQRALAGDQEAAAALEEAVTHYDVVMKALSEGKQVPFDVVAEYPSLLEPESNQEHPANTAAAEAEEYPHIPATSPLPAIKSARKRSGPARVVKAHEVGKFGRHGMVSEYLVTFQDGRFPCSVEALDRSQAVKFAQAERRRLDIGGTPADAALPNPLLQGQVQAESISDTWEPERVGAASDSSEIDAPEAWLVSQHQFKAQAIAKTASDGTVAVHFHDQVLVTDQTSPAKALTAAHKQAVRLAFADGKQVPFHVLVDYPEVAYGPGERAARSVSKLLSEAGLAERLMIGFNSHVRLVNPPYMDLIIERLPAETTPRLCLTHYLESNGDRFIDSEMIFEIRPAGHLVLCETAVQNPIRGGELRGLDRSFANIFSQNLLQQGFSSARLEWSDDADESLEDGPEIRLQEGMAIVENLAAEFNAQISSWEASDPSTVGKWRYTTLDRSDVSVRIAVSQGGVVQVNGDPFTKGERVLHVTDEAIRESLSAAFKLEPANATSPSLQLSPYELGMRTAEHGVKCVPAWDKELMAALGGKVGDGIPAMREWMKGWHEINAQRHADELPRPSAIDSAGLDDITHSRNLLRLPSTAPVRLPIYGINPKHEAARYTLPEDFYAETSFNGYRFFAPAERYRSTDFSQAERNLYAAHKQGDHSAVKSARQLMMLEMTMMVAGARATLPQDELTASTMQAGDRVRFTPTDTGKQPLTGVVSKVLENSAGDKGFELIRDAAEAISEVETCWVADGSLQFLPPADPVEAFQAALAATEREVAPKRRVQALIRVLCADRGVVSQGDWVAQPTSSPGVPADEAQLVAFMERHLPSPASFNIAVGLDQFLDVPSEPKRLADAVRRLGDSLRGFKANHLRKTAARIEDLRTIAPENAMAIELLESAATTVNQAESILADLEARLATLKSEEEERNWERFEPFGAQAVTKPLASEIGFTKAWIDKENGWFQVRNGASIAWTNGHVFDLEEPNYRGFEKNESRRFQNTPLAKRPDISRFLEYETGDAMKPVFVYRRMHDDKDAVILARSSGRLVSLDKRYHDYIAVKYPGVVFSVANDWEIGAPNHGSLVHAKLDGKIVAGVMPLRGLDPTYTVDLVEAKIGAVARKSAQAEQDSSEVENLLYETEQRVKGRAMATAMIQVALDEGRWYSAITTHHHQGNHSGRSEPMTCRGDGFVSRFDAVFHAGNRIVLEQRRIARSQDSVTTPKQKSEALKMADWALKQILGELDISWNDRTPGQGWYEARRTGPEYHELCGTGLSEADALDALRERIEAALSQSDHCWKSIGSNDAGETLEENTLGIRSIVKDGLRVSEPATSSQHGGPTTLRERPRNFLTMDEATSPASTSSTEPGAASPATHQVGDLLDNATVHAVIRGTAISLIHRKLSKYDPRRREGSSDCFWARAFIGGEWRPLGQPWPKKPSQSSLETALGAACNAPVFDSDAFFTQLNEAIDQSNIGADKSAAIQHLDQGRFRALPLDDHSYELRFKDRASPFFILVEYQSPGTYLPNTEGGVTGPKTSLSSACAWAVRELDRLQTHYERRLQEQNKDNPRFDVDAASFMELFPADHDGQQLLEHVLQVYQQKGMQRRIGQGQQQDADLPAELQLIRSTDQAIIVRLDDLDCPLSIELRCAMETPGRRPWNALQAIQQAVAALQTETAWSRLKKERGDAGIELERVAQGYAEFMRAQDPDRHSGIPGRMHREFALALVDKDIDHLLGWLARPRGQNDLSKRYFTQVTGTKLAKTAKEITVAIYGWAGYSPEQASQIEAEKQRRRDETAQQRAAESHLQHVLAQLERTHYRHNGAVVTARQFVDDIVAGGFDSLETKRVGAVDRYRLVNRAEDRLYEISGQLVDYARHVLAERAKRLDLEVAEEPSAEPSRPRFG
ncbi:TPA: hypothetical protein ACRMMX_002300 [Pseudomonas aeruginosa]|nr:hypothetical protein [Pseudomonas aeruginosa]